MNVAHTKSNRRNVLSKFPPVRNLNAVFIMSSISDSCHVTEQL